MGLLGYTPVGFAPLSPRVKGYVQSPFGYDAFYGVSVDGK